MDSERRKALLARREEFQQRLFQQRQRESCQDLLTQLDAESATYQIIWTDTTLFNPATHWLTQKFPIAWWGRVDWKKFDSLAPSSLAGRGLGVGFLYLTHR